MDMAMDMDMAGKIALLKDVFELGDEKLTPDTELEKLDNWDSMTKLALIVAVEDNFGKILSSDDIRSFVVVNDILCKMEP